MSNTTDPSLLSLLDLATTTRNAVVGIFSEMIPLPYDLEDAAADPVAAADRLHMRVSLDGRVAGSVLFGLSLPLAVEIAAAMMCDEPENLDEATILDVVGELANMVGGCIKTDLCNVGLECRLHPPEKVDQPPAPTKSALQATFRCDQHLLQVVLDLSLRPA